MAFEPAITVGVTNAFGGVMSSGATLTVNEAPPTASRYVDFTAGDDDNPGTTNSPWKHCPGMREWTGQATLDAGDVVYFDRNDTWTFATTNLSGPGFDLAGGVHYIGDEWDPEGGGANRAILTATARQEAGLVRFWADHPDFVTWLEGFELDGNNQRLNLVDINHRFFNQIAQLTGGIKRIEDCVCHGNDGDGSENDFRYGIIASDNHAEMESPSNVGHVEILNCEVYDVPRDAICAYPGDWGHVFDFTVRGCTVYNTGQDPSYSEGHGLLAKGYVRDVVFEYNTVTNVNSSAVFINGPESNELTPAPSNVVVRFNILHTDDNNATVRLFDGVASTSGKQVDVYGNIILPNEQTGGFNMAGNQGGHTVRVWNNTFYNAFVDLGNPSGSGTIDFRNNLIYELDDTCLVDAGGDITTHANNLFYRVSGLGLVSSSGTTYSNSNLGTYEATAVNADPLFSSTNAIPTGFAGAYPIFSPDANGLSLQSASPAIDAGVNLGGFGSGFRGTVDSKQRALGVETWDIGAYEQQPIEPPGGLLSHPRKANNLIFLILPQ